MELILFVFRSQRVPMDVKTHTARCPSHRCSPLDLFLCSCFCSLASNSLRIPWVTEALGKLISFYEHQHVDACDAGSPAPWSTGHRLSDRLSGVGSGGRRASMEALEKWVERYAGRVVDAETRNWKCWLPCHKHLQKLAYDCYTHCINKDCNQRGNFNAIAVIRKCWKHILEWNDQGRTQEKYPV
jgi:hypothetical protein